MERCKLEMLRLKLGIVCFWLEKGEFKVKLKHEELSFEQLKRSYDLKGFTCETTETVPQIKGMIGQDRAIRAIEFGLNIDSPGYNIYVAGPSYPLSRV